MADINFYAGEDFEIYNLGGSGIGWYGDGGFGTSVVVGEYPDSAYITNAAGAIQGPQAENNKYSSASGVDLGVGQILLTQLPNYQTTLNIAFTHTSAVKVQNARLYFYDRTSENNAPSGVTVKAAEIVHPDNTQTISGSGDSLWQVPAGSSYLPLVDSPGISGLSPNGPDTSDTRHDWYVAVSPTPTSAGAKDKFGVMMKLEYL